MRRVNAISHKIRPRVPARDVSNCEVDFAKFVARSLAVRLSPMQVLGKVRVLTFACERIVTRRRFLT